MMEKEKQEVAVAQNSVQRTGLGSPHRGRLTNRCTKEADIAFSTAMVSEAKKQTTMAKAKPDHPEFGPDHPKNRKPLPSEDPELGAEDNPKRKPVPGERLEVQRFGSLVFFHKYTPGKGWSTRCEWQLEKPSRRKKR